MALRQPRVVVFGDLLSDQECDAIPALAGTRLARSETVATGSEGSEVNAARTSDGMFFERGETDLITRIERRIATLLRWPLDHGEGLQVLGLNELQTAGPANQPLEARLAQLEAALESFCLDGAPTRTLHTVPLRRALP